ncbi:high affinity immunoglobulin gamma Fc receptor I-like isoform X2 [Engystomops pustulosus]|uniref:high affinity immunoglobulin gamma Fc receptor I-like isoform X2 n=1 Tax=Engystomops pustulosus TaxID=76066 RepID=UPI003AFA9147
MLPTQTQGHPALLALSPHCMSTNNPPTSVQHTGSTSIMAATHRPAAATMYVPSLLLLIILTTEIVGAVLSPVVSFNPDWNKIFTGESINLTCDTDSSAEDVTYEWFKDGYWIHSGKTFTISSAQTSNSGGYQCQTSAGDRSDSTRLDVHHGYVILQASPHVYEGDNLTLRCHHYPGHPAGQTIFYRNDAVIKSWGPEDELLIEKVDMTSNSKYKCTKQVNHHLLYYQHSDETSISVQELIPLPTLRTSSHSAAGGDRVTLTCQARLSPLRQSTELQFAFYHNGENIQEFSLSNKYEIPYMKQSNSGDYKCEIAAMNYRLKKMSAAITLHVEQRGDSGSSHFITIVSVTSLVLVLALIVTIVVILYRKRHVLPGNHHQPTRVACGDPDTEMQNIYTDPDVEIKWQNSSLPPNYPHQNDLGTKKDFILC